MLLRRVSITVSPMSWEQGGDLHKMRIEVDTADRAYVTENVLRPDDFTSRFDLIIDNALRALKYELQLDRPPRIPLELLHGQAEEAGSATFHAQAGQDSAGEAAAR